MVCSTTVAASMLGHNDRPLEEVGVNLNKCTEIDRWSPVILPSADNERGSWAIKIVN